MSYATPRLRWSRMRDTTDDDGRPVLELPAELSALSPAALALLRIRLARCSHVTEVAVRRGPEDVLGLSGATMADVTAEKREAADNAIATVAADAAAGWTARDEVERHRPFAWG